MPLKTAEELKAIFTTGAKPTAEDFAAFINATMFGKPPVEEPVIVDVPAEPDTANLSDWLVTPGLIRATSSGFIYDDFEYTGDALDRGRASSPAYAAGDYVMRFEFRLEEMPADGELAVYLSDVQLADPDAVPGYQLKVVRNADDTFALFYAGVDGIFTQKYVFSIASVHPLTNEYAILFDCSWSQTIVSLVDLFTGASDSTSITETFTNVPVSVTFDMYSGVRQQRTFIEYVSIERMLNGDSPVVPDFIDPVEVNYVEVKSGGYDGFKNGISYSTAAVSTKLGEIHRFKNSTGKNLHIELLAGPVAAPCYDRFTIVPAGATVQVIGFETRDAEGALVNVRFEWQHDDPKFALDIDNNMFTEEGSFARPWMPTGTGEVYAHYKNLRIISNSYMGDFYLQWIAMLGVETNKIQALLKNGTRYGIKLYRSRWPATPGNSYVFLPAGSSIGISSSTSETTSVSYIPLNSVRTYKRLLATGNYVSDPEHPRNTQTIFTNPTGNIVGKNAPAGAGYGTPSLSNTIVLSPSDFSRLMSIDFFFKGVKALEFPVSVVITGSRAGLDLTARAFTITYPADNEIVRMQLSMLFPGGVDSVNIALTAPETLVGRGVMRLGQY